MKAFVVSGVELDRCTFCKGLWFDGGELEQVLKKPANPQLDAGETARRCATCKTPMRPGVLGRLRVEACATCRGIFLDEGELVALNDGKPVRVTMGAPPKREASPPVADAKVGQAVDDWLKELGM
ncbi:MAG: zf-TFIIB domain-containing protein [Myxococcaceae bacterium]|nr:zf-TFIIB domain-containing protein [Myxococcaceae bacterium]